MLFKFSLLVFFLSYFTSCFAAFEPALTGTWSTKSRKVITGPGFYDPMADRFKEPDNTGISYSFTNDGFWEQAYYRAISNPTEPACPGAMLQFQHGKYSVESNGSLVLTPFAVDGRQMITSPCKDKDAAYFRFNRTEIFQRYEVQIDGFHNVKRLNLYRFDGSPMNPMFLVFDPPEMLPTETLSPIAKGHKKARRDILGEGTAQSPHNKFKSGLTNRDNLWWAGVVMTLAGSAGFFYTSLPWNRIRRQ